MFHCGAQLVSYNTQHIDIYNVVIRCMFMVNEDCGYIQKPANLLINSIPIKNIS